MAPARKKKKSGPKVNPWMIISILIILILSGFIVYDKSPTVHNGINKLIGYEDDMYPVIEQIRIDVLNDKTLEDPTYDVNEQFIEIEDEFNIDLVISQVDINDEKGKKYIEDYKLKSVPVVFFEEKLIETDFYEETKNYFNKENDKYVLILQPLKFLELPTTENAAKKGPDTAKVKIIEFSSFSCPYCSTMKPILYRILEEYPNDVQLVYKQFNRGGVDSVLENAAECAGDQEKFWEMHDYIFDNQKSIGELGVDEFLATSATQVGLDSTQFNDCVNAETHSERIREHTEEGFKFGVTGTPSFFINDTFIGGAVDYSTLKKAIDSYL